ncbi:allene oxide synthase 3-like [Silene latifolia]|uniref:allene oxide synthase 3-like n=1 Tax=Silene latifolia TaxID=37657 RepID=UPI003D77D076
MSNASKSSESSKSSHHPPKEIPGSYGVPFFGAMKDRWDFFYLQGRDLFFKSRMEKHNSSIFRANMPPGPWISPDPRVVVLLDANSFPVLFDTSKVEKRDVLDGTYMPSTSFTGGHRVCAYLDTSEHKHGSLKALFQSFLASKSHEFIPLFRSCMQSLFVELEDGVRDPKGVEFGSLTDNLSFEFIFRLLCDGKCPSDTKLESDGATMIKKWLVFQLTPLVTIGLHMMLNPIEDFLLHCMKLPFFLVKNDYNKVYEAFHSSATSYLDKAEKSGISRDEACHNLVFVAGFNAFGGMSIWFPSLIKWVALAGESVHRELVDEIRTVVQSEGGVTFNSINKMVLTKSVVYEALRIDPPVPYQYGRAREDMVIHSHDSAYKVKKGEMIFGYQPFATKDPKIFDKPEEFVSHRFVGEEGEKLLKYVLWSNGRETDAPTMENKQCPGKDLVVLMSRLLLVELFLRYDTISVQAKSSGLTNTLTITSVTKATC